jgi:hypothetical protein
MREERVVIVHLRRPNKNDPNERRSDPFWEFGSFGCTKCHSKNLMNPKKAVDEIQGVRLAFAQGGKDGFKLVYLTPPIKIIQHKHCCEARWIPATMPFKYSTAPLLIDNVGNSDVPSFAEFLKKIDRSTWMARFSSSFRSRKKHLPPDIGANLIAAFNKALRKPGESALAKHYHEALPYDPTIIDRQRRKTYESLLAAANSSKSSTNGRIIKSSSCSSKKRGPFPPEPDLK